MLQGHHTKAHRTRSLSPPTGASQIDRERRGQRYVPAAHHLQRLKSSPVRRPVHLHTSHVIYAENYENINLALTKRQFLWPITHSTHQ